MVRLDLKGKKFNRLTVLDFSHIDKRGRTMWLCECSCGTVKILRGSEIKIGQIKSCGCLKDETIVKSNRIEFGESTLNSIYASYRCRAINKKLEFSLTKEQFKSLITSECHYCGATPNLVKKSKYNNGDFNYLGIDRINSSEGYTIKNCVPCCLICNRAKNNLSYNEFISYLIRIQKRSAWE